MTAAAPTADRPATAADVEALRAEIRTLTALVRGKLNPAPPQLTLDEAVKLKLSRHTLMALVARGVFTDHRGLKRRGSPIRLYADELQAYREDGIEGVRRLREDMGRL